MQSGKAAKSLGYADSVIAKAKAGDEVETLMQRINAYRADSDREVNTSIEGFRLQ